MKAAGIGILPEELIGKTEAVGNSSLKGAVMAAYDEEALKRFEQTAAMAREVSLSESALFNELYVEYMFF